ncbi:Death-associated protein kinase 3 [Bagarius yarrelli]|uniref:Death-associated protein kinase 3 n=1 Tax=Bagarius yarrelli TaxID=175774 RepID=A0A556U6E8_BAGYA|nr:Death-associated protein kinase 3 [Bagarius yarrelli]
MAQFKLQNVEDFYEIGEVLGSGHFGQVRELRERASATCWAGKFVKLRRSVSSRLGVDRKNVEHEVEILQNLQHVNIMALRDVFESRAEIVLVVELIRGGELFDFIAAKENLTENEAIDFLKQILKGVGFMHSKQIAHFDLKPENIMLSDKNEEHPEIKIIDFGLAHRFDAGEEYRSLGGTPQYIAPEVINYEPLSIATDMWLSGISPFQGETDEETLRNIVDLKYDFDEHYFSQTSQMAKDFIEKLLVKDQRLSRLQLLCKKAKEDEELMISTPQHHRIRMPDPAMSPVCFLPSPGPPPVSSISPASPSMTRTSPSPRMRKLMLTLPLAGHMIKVTGNRRHSWHPDLVQCSHLQQGQRSVSLETLDPGEMEKLRCGSLKRRDPRRAPINDYVEDLESLLSLTEEEEGSDSQLFSFPQVQSPLQSFSVSVPSLYFTSSERRPSFTRKRPHSHTQAHSSLSSLLGGSTQSVEIWDSKEKTEGQEIENEESEKPNGLRSLVRSLSFLGKMARNYKVFLLFLFIIILLRILLLHLPEFLNNKKNNQILMKCVGKKKIDYGLGDVAS